MAPAPLVYPARARHTATVIFAHGLGDSGAGWSFLAKQLGQRFSHIKWVFPNAPEQPVTLNFGMVMPSWFDITGLDENAKEDEKGLLASVSKINSLITEEVDAGIPSKRIVVGGFSQGACIGLLTGLTTERQVAGIASLSGFLPLRTKIIMMRTEHSTKLPVFWGHGTADQVVRYKWGEDSVKFLRDQLKMQTVEFKSYKGVPHSASEEELEDLADWLEKVIPEAVAEGASEGSSASGADPKM